MIVIRGIDCNKIQSKAAGVGNDGRIISQVSCPELIQALKRSEWFESEKSSCHFNSTTDENRSSGKNDYVSGNNATCKKGLLRPVKDVNLPCCGMRMQMGMKVDTF